jgi:hypothetical protein
MLAAQYAKTLAPNLIGFPKSVGDAACTSLGEALEVARRLGPAGARLADVSKTAFIEAMHSSLLVLGVLIAVSAVLIGLWAPGRDDRQLRLVRRLLEWRRPK